MTNLYPGLPDRYGSQIVPEHSSDLKSKPKINPRYPMNVLLGLILKRQRELKALTQEQVAEWAGCHASYLSAIENGHSELSIRIFDRLCKALAVSAHVLYAQAEYLECHLYRTQTGDCQLSDGLNPLAAQGWVNQFLTDSTCE